jgi:hypothetical protein
MQFNGSVLGRVNGGPARQCCHVLLRRRRRLCCVSLLGPRWQPGCCNNYGGNGAESKRASMQTLMQDLRLFFPPWGNNLVARFCGQASAA